MICCDVCTDKREGKCVDRFDDEGSLHLCKDHADLYHAVFDLAHEMFIKSPHEAFEYMAKWNSDQDKAKTSHRPLSLDARER